MSPVHINIAIADDHRILRQAFQEALSKYSFINVLFDASSGEELLSNLKSLQPHVILLDIKMPGMSGIQALKVIHENYPEIKVLILSAYFDETYIAECLTFGINGFLTKNMDMSEIAKAINMAGNNEVYFTNLLSNTILRKYLRDYHKADHELLPTFTDEEMKIIRLLLNEKTTDEIADTMCLSKRTIEVKREKMKKKAHVKTTVGLLLHCLKRELV